MFLTHRGPTICAKKGTSLIVWMSLEELGTSPSSANDLLCDFSKSMTLSEPPFPLLKNAELSSTPE